ncbi:CDP-alcohol phosphatidyltransferase family protein [Adlercreutzia sp. ZJ138]|uniref:CDP-alcohol phosphatidyltransferase family protein n=1 Tax=Adlercreutzia sp. ZJ138 TaxID=2709405 RepID=UPI0013ED57D7|nr:CDP-alcohol phosphatidyltransferase family protein [Adlercreutzia sp. ZJ138]
MPRHVDTVVNTVSNKVLTVPNVISAIRLCLIPVFFVVLLSGHDVAAAIIFAIAAGTDCIDGQIARRTNAVTRLGQLLDPAVDRLLMISGVLGVFLVGRLPLWIILFVLARDLFLLVGSFYLLRSRHIRIPVVFAGKASTTFLFIGFAGLLLNAPLISGLGWVSFDWLPGFNADPCSWSIWFLYVGLVLSAVTAVYYAYSALRELREHPSAARMQRELGHE